MKDMEDIVAKLVSKWLFISCILTTILFFLTLFTCATKGAVLWFVIGFILLGTVFAIIKMVKLQKVLDEIRLEKGKDL